MSTRSYFRKLAEGHENGPLAYALTPVLEAASACYGVVNGTIRGLYESKILRRTKLPFPVISVGNLTWGGAGKTPFVEYLVRRISERQRTPLILTRGYSHDEVEQFKAHLPKVVIGVGKDRVKTALEEAAKQKIDVAVLDDGLQHWPIERNFEIVMVNALNPFGNRRLIPRGVLREPVSMLKKADMVVLFHVNLISKKSLESLKQEIRNAAPKVPMVEACLEPLFFYRARKKARVPLEKLQNQKVTTFSAVGVPRSFQLLLASNKIKPVRNFEFTDHHVFSKNELDEIKTVSDSVSATDIVTTEKDYYRCSEMLASTINPLVLATRLRIASGEEHFMRTLYQILEGRYNPK